MLLAGGLVEQDVEADLAGRNAVNPLVGSLVDSGDIQRGAGRPAFRDAVGIARQVKPAEVEVL